MSGDAAQILIADDEANLRRVLAAQLAREGYRTHAVADGQAALEAMQDNPVDVVISDLRMPRVDGMALLRRLHRDHPEVPVILITAHGTVDTAVEALKLGAFDYVTKPFDQAELRNVVAKAVRTRALAAHEVSAPPQASAEHHQLIGDSAAMRSIYEVLDKVADTPSTVLLTGESGTGKELIARALHESSGRRDKPFVRVNCAAIPSELIESELFGYERGAFTGAVTSKPGRFELAHGGTLFLDEIGEVPLNMQVKLLRAIQESEFERVGGLKTLRVDVRLVAATNRDLAVELESGRFREDLYYRLNVVQLRLPALRERREDIPLLIEHFITKFNRRLGKRILGCTPELVAQLSAHPWKGNIRELENIIERCVLFCDTDRLQPADLPPEFSLPSRLSVPVNPASPGGLKEEVRVAVAQFERQRIVTVLEETSGNVTRAAKRLQISRKSLQTKMKKHGLRAQHEDSRE